MAFELNQINEAYNKLKTYIYYDNNDLILRRQFVEFESNRTKDVFFDMFGGPSIYKDEDDVFNSFTQLSSSGKLAKILIKLNEYHKDPSFFNKLIDDIDVNFYPKKIKEKDRVDSFISNKTVLDNYEVERVTPFIYAPIELHIISVLWILEFGYRFDAELGDCCLGNRLILNKENDKVVQGSGLFKPYFKQYKKWRDDSVFVAESLLKQGKDVLFLNLDIKDYYHSVRIKKTDLVDVRYKEVLPEVWSLQDIFFKLHEKYTKIVSKQYQTPHEFFSLLNKNSNNDIEEVILPIGLLSSYVIGNHYLKKFDNRISGKIKPAYYGRYVDDILIVLSDPNPNYNNEEDDEGIKFNFEKYKEKLNKRLPEQVSFDEKHISKIEKYILENFYPVVTLINSPSYLGEAKDFKKPEGRLIKLCGYKSLFCQSSKSLLYYFDHKESSLVIDKLKKELEERTSEFRDLPDEDDNDSFEDSAYHLQYDGTDGKIRTLKDYRENRFGLTLYLSNRIFSALRHEKKISDDEREQVLKFFRGENCIKFYKLWERIFTFFLVNDQATAYVDFYLHCASQIDKINSKSKRISTSQVDSTKVRETLVEYLDCSHEIALSLNPSFINKAKQASLNFTFQLEKLKSKSFTFFDLAFEPTNDKSYWVLRFRMTNMIRHQYVLHPLLSFTDGAKSDWIDLTSLKIDFRKYKLDPYLVQNSPRPVKFWECCLALVFFELGTFYKANAKQDRDYLLTDVLGIKSKKVQQESKIDDDSIVFGNEFYLEDAFLLYKCINRNHIPNYLLNDEDLKNRYFSRQTNKLKFDKWKPLKIQEIKINSNLNNRIESPRIAFVNTEVDEKSIISSMRGEPNLSAERYQKLAKILRFARKDKANILLFPEFFIPVNLLSSIVRFSEKEQMLTVTGLEHITIDDVAFNFIVTILPTEINGVKDAVVVLRLKNHYAHIEEYLIQANHLIVPKPSPYRYDIFNWRNLYFSAYYCFELANAIHRSLLKGKIDLLVGVEWNKDTPYFSNIVESSTRDLHAYVAQVNTSQFGDTRLTQPVESAIKDILKLKGGINDSVLVASINIPKLREFQRKKFFMTHKEKEYKPLPPDYLLDDVLKRIRNENVF
ncbi:MAG: RNA-directed DNA polymerase [Rufibacter sp.]